MEICGESKDLGSSEGFELFIANIYFISFIRLQGYSQIDETRQLNRGKGEFFKIPACEMHLLD